MDRINDNKGTPTKRTGVKNDYSSQNSKNKKDNNPTPASQPEIAQPNPLSATPTFPTEIPTRDTVS
jgi:hypothetical protein